MKLYAFRISSLPTTRLNAWEGQDSTEQRLYARLAKERGHGRYVVVLLSKNGETRFHGQVEIGEKRQVFNPENVGRADPMSLL